MPDNFASKTTDLDSPARNAAAVTPHDSNDLPVTSRGLYIGVAGDVVAILAGDTVAVTFKSVPIGILPVCAKRVTTATTATNILALS